MIRMGKSICHITVMFISFRTDSLIRVYRLLLEEQFDQGLHCLPFHLHLFDDIPYDLASLFEF